MKKVISVGLFLALGLAVSCSSDTNNPPPGCSPACTGDQVCTAGACVTPPPPLGCKVASDCTGTSNACNSSNVCVCGTKANAAACTGGNYCSESTSTCEKSRTIFATQYSVTPGTAYSVNGVYNSTSTTIASAADADTVCKAAALINTTKTPGTYQALIGKKGVTPLGRINLANDPVPVFNTVGKQVAASVNALGALDVTLGAAILNETGVAMASTNIFTGSTALNQTPLAGNNCNDWLATGTLSTPTVGLGNNTGAISWWYNNGASGASCIIAAPIYCIQVD